MTQIVLKVPLNFNTNQPVSPLVLRYWCYKFVDRWGNDEGHWVASQLASGRTAGYTKLWISRPV